MLLIAGGLGLGLAVVPGGCVDWRIGGGTEPRLGDVGEGVWRIHPVRMRVYPSTRLVVEDGDPVLEARIEFTDAAGDPTKAVGDLRFELHSLAATSQTRRQGDLLYRWQVSMRTLQDNHLYYDPITRAYLYRLRMDEALAVGQPLLLNVTFLPPLTNGEPPQAAGWGPRLEASFRMNVAGGS